jgi:large subunit ribosomal protein L7Ae
MMPKTPLNRYVKWPKYVRIQRQRQVLKKRLRIPPAINQFTKTLDKNMATNLFKMLMKYRPEDNAQKKERLTDMAKDAAEGKESDVKKPVVVKYGINHITYLVEQGKAELVVIAHDVDPLELVIWLPALCQRMNVPYCIVKGKARLGAVVHKKTATALALTAVKQEDKMELSKLVEAIKASYNEKAKEHQRKWGGSIMGVKSQAKTAKRLKKMSKELGGESK